MAGCQWDSVVPSPYSLAPTGLELMFMGVTQSKSGVFRLPGFLVSPVEKEKGGQKKNGRREKGHRKGKEGRE